MAQQITIDIVAETRKLSEGLNNATSEVESMSSKFKGLTAAATAAASAFVLREGVSFLKDGIAEAKDAEIAMNKATSAFGAGSSALAQITKDSEKFGKALGVDNDDLIKLSTQLGTYLPKDAQYLSAQLVNLGYDVAALTGLDPESWVKKFAKGMADGTLKAGDMQKMIPGLTDAIYAQAEAMFKAGNAQGALNLLITEGQKRYGDAAEKNVTAAQKFDVALANLKETIGTKILPIVEKFTNFLTTLIDAFSALPGPMQNVLLILTAIVGIGGPVLGFISSFKTSLEVLGLAQKASTAAQALMNVTMMGFPLVWILAAIAAVVAIIIVMVKNWDSISAVISKVWSAIKDFTANAWQGIKDFADKIGGFIKGIVDKFNGLKDAMLNIGANLVKGLWNGMAGMLDWLKDKLENSFVGKIIGKVMNLFGEKSPSKVFAEIGTNLVKGLAIGVEDAQKFAIQSMVGLSDATLSAFSPTLVGTTGAVAPINVTINAGLGTDPYALGREVNNALTKYGKVSSRVVRG